MVYLLYSDAESVWFHFEFDEQKSRANKAKHGIDFIQAQQLWLDEDRWEFPANNLDEPRFLVVGLHADRLWTAVITHRGETIRVISVRRARRREAEAHGR
jgi:uncharacterized DUF497 family protein